MPPKPQHRTFTVHFQYFAEIKPHTFQLNVAGFYPIVDGNVLSFCDAEGMEYRYNWDLIAHTTLTKEEKP